MYLPLNTVKRLDDFNDLDNNCERLWDFGAVQK